MKTIKGKWYSKDGQIISINTGKTLAIIPYFYEDNEEEVANAIVMATSPELLNACENIMWAHSQLTSAGFHKEVEEIRAAIQKAKYE